MAGKVEVDLDETNGDLYNDDPRTPCKYGSECYQKNPLHKKKYKHPPQVTKRQCTSPESTINDPKLKKQKIAADSTSELAPSKNGSEVSSSVNLSKREEISDSEEDEADQLPSRPVVIPTSDPDSPTAPLPSKREEISESDSDSSSVQGNIEEDSYVKSSSNKQSDAQSPKGKRQEVEMSPKDKQKEVGVSPKDKQQEVGVSPKEKQQEVGVSPKDAEEIIKEMFLVEMPEDFYKFWLLCKSLSKNNPAGAFSDAGLLLVGPYDVVAGKLKSYDSSKKDNYLIHWRYYYDPPEFQTVIKGDDKSQFHMGYYRDDPADLPCFVASNSAAKDYIIKPMAENIFGAVNSFLEFAQRTSNPFQKMKLSRLQKVVQSWANDNKYTLDTNTPSMKNRNRKVVSKTFHQAGIVVPLEKKTELGYRELIETDAKLKTILKMVVESKSDKERTVYLEKLQPIITAADIANDECDFGTSLELGMDLFSFGGKVLHGSILHLLTTAYSLLRRPAFKDIIVAHLKDRRRGNALSILEADDTKA